MEGGKGTDMNYQRPPGVILLIAMSVAVAACWPSSIDQRPAGGSKTVVFVHGAWAGGWHFSKVQPLLEARGHTVYRPTLTGLGERVHLAHKGVTLDTHVQDIVNVIEFEDLRDIALVGHSYGGMVIAGVAERVPERISALVFLDAILPENGESVASLFGDATDGMARRGDGDEAWKLIPLWVQPGERPPVDVPQPLATFTQPIELANPAAAALPGSFILTHEAGEHSDDFAPFANRAGDRGWRVIVMQGGHNPHWFQPEGCADVVLQAIREARAPNG
jgi:pimeloyl-ACP methyl ester carboxylesterase